MTNNTFRPVEPSGRVKEFLHKSPEADWEEALIFLLDHFPQTEDDRVIWVVEGGVAVKLLDPSRPIPGDVDIITRSSEMKRELVNSRKFDAKLPEEWLRNRGFDSTDAPVDLLLSRSSPCVLRESHVLVLEPSMLAISKRYSFYPNRPRRRKDDDDLRRILLHTSEDEIAQCVAGLESVPGRS